MKKYKALKDIGDIVKKGKRIKSDHNKNDRYYVECDTSPNIYRRSELNSQFIDFLLSNGFIEEVEAEREFPEKLKTIDSSALKIVGDVYKSYPKHLLWSHYKFPLSQKLIVTAWMHEFAEWYNDGETECKYTIYIAVDNEFTANHSILVSYEPEATYFKDGDFVEIFNEHAPEEIKSYLRGER